MRFEKVIPISLIVASVLMQGCIPQRQEAIVPPKKNETVVSPTISAFLGERPKTTADSVLTAANKISAKTGKPVIYSGDDIPVTEQIEFGSYEDIADFIKAKNLPYTVGIERYQKFDKVSISKQDSIEGKLKEVSFKASGTLNPLLEAQNLAASLGLALSLDAHSSNVLNKETPLAFTGSCFDFFSQIADSNNLFFSVKDGKVFYRQFDERLFAVTMTPLSIGSTSTQTLSSNTATTTTGSSTAAGASNSNSSNASASSGSTSADLSFSYKIYEELVASIKNIVGAEGSYHLNQASGQLFIRAKKDQMAIAKKIIDGFNETYSKIIEVKVSIAEVSLTDKFEAGINFGILAKGLEANLKSSTVTATGSTILLNSAWKKWGGSDDVTSAISLLKQFGDTKIDSKAVATTVNAVPTYGVSMEEQDYISELTQTAGTSTTAATWSTKKSTANSGLSFYIFPKIQPDGKIIVTLQPKLAKHISFEPFSPSTGSFVQTENRDRKEFTTTVILSDGGTAIIGNIASSTAQRDKQGLPVIQKADNWVDFIGGSRTTSNAKKEVVIFITAAVVNK